MTLPAAILFDMDGTFVDTEKYWQAAEIHYFQSIGVPWEAGMGDELAGRSLVESIGIMSAKSGVDLDVDHTVTTLVDSVHDMVVENGVPWLPGSLELVDLCRTTGISTALVTSSYRKFAQAVVDRAPTDTFDVVIAGDEVTHPKPDPEPYLKAAHALGVPPSQCIVFEDSPSGVQAGIAAGALTFALPGFNPVPDSLGAKKIESLTHVDEQWLRNAWTQWSTTG
ncbi:MAG: HAD family phosphatase [Actinomycetaceae bacterium]|nr:HAD family phosphatase [Actinomycetaceae bacterium]